jgi:CRP-like cAMP-binding protein
MFVVCSGRVAVTLAGGREVAAIDEGGYFGEMSLLTGEPRTATVVARGDVRVMEVSAASFRQLAAADPAAMERIAALVAQRRVELDEARNASAAPVAETRASLLTRMRRSPSACWPPTC